MRQILLWSPAPPDILMAGDSSWLLGLYRVI
jgi:hypothetical protein